MRKTKIFGTLVVLLVISGGVFFSGSAPDVFYKLLPGYFEDTDESWAMDPFAPSEVTKAALPFSVVEDRIQRQEKAKLDLGIDTSKVILFGDTHVHTTNSTDAFLFSLPALYGGEGAFPPSYASDYARFVSQLDFFFLTDHSESYTRERWLDAIASLRQCDALAGEKGKKDVIPFMGYEWTQSGSKPSNHYGHHNVLFRDLDDDALPKRPIAASSESVGTVAARSYDAKLPSALQILDPRHKDYYKSYNRLIEEMADTPVCDMSIPSPQLPADCFESVPTPEKLFERLDQWGIDTIVVPHGTSWGNYSPPESSWVHQLNPQDADPDKTRLIEVYSGHGSSEIFINQKERPLDENGTPYCPEPTEGYLPGCWQAGEIIRNRCLKDGESDAECESRAIAARQNYVDVESSKGFLTVPNTSAYDWLDAGQARDQFLPAFNLRVKKSVQYGLALRNFEPDGEPLRYTWGLIGSTDTHTARSGHGFKQFMRLYATEANGARDDFWTNLILGKPPETESFSTPLSEINIPKNSRSIEFERIGSFLSVGGLAAVHAKDRTREAVWDAMKKKEVYGTSGPRLLLWFDMLNGPEGKIPMGSQVKTNVNPRFQVKAVGSFKQKPGCPDYVKEALEAHHLKKLSQGECYNPSQERHLIQRIEVVRIRPQNHEGEPIAPLIENKWKTFDCAPDTKGCTVEFEDPDYADAGRDTIYYVRALEEATPTINGANLRTTFDDQGNAISTNPCFGDHRTDNMDDCLAPENQRAWSSPIFVDFKM